MTLETANSIYLRNTFEARPEYKNFSKLYFQSEVSELDFNNVQETIDIINTWAGERTHQKIPSIVTASMKSNQISKPKTKIFDFCSSENIDKDTNIILLNAIYFKGRWDQPFLERFTKMRPFYLGKNKTKNVSTMVNEFRLIWGEVSKLEARFVKLPYQVSRAHNLLLNQSLALFYFLLFVIIEQKLANDTDSSR